MILPLAYTEWPFPLRHSVTLAISMYNTKLINFNVWSSVSHPNSFQKIFVLFDYLANQLSTQLTFHLLLFHLQYYSYGFWLYNGLAFLKVKQIYNCTRGSNTLKLWLLRMWVKDRSRSLYKSINALSPFRVFTKRLIGQFNLKGHGQKRGFSITVLYSVINYGMTINIHFY